MKEYYYHITGEHEDWLKIGEEGLRAGHDGYIYLLTTKESKVVISVCMDQIGAWENFGLIRVDPKGITATIEEDNVAEFAAKYQRRVKQDIIQPKFIKRLKMCKIVEPKSSKE